MPWDVALCFGLLVILLIVIFVLFLRSDLYNLKCHEVKQGKHRVCVLNSREGQKNDQAVAMMTDLTEKLTRLVRLAHADNPAHPGIQRLVANFDPRRVVESLPHSNHTAYTEDKGKKLAFCLTKERKGGRFVEENTLFFVALHELAHIMTEENGHTENFWRHFGDILRIARRHQMIIPVDYSKEPTKYCGMTLYENPLFDREDPEAKSQS
jgi:hypothetical protein